MRGQAGCCDQSLFRAFSLWSREVRNVPVKEGFLLDNINYYRKHINPVIKKELGVRKLCPFTPSCSSYAKESIRKRGPFVGFMLGAFRILRCNGTGGGYDPVK
ncbi:MAG: membrane protein insertion efficiency factor YidD [Candidatus Aenigmarchaeota archaeon]|nr:membrane protein insertion efficiency factor YidD [Candidatus Aenigmarchaeota archaeon]